jgi:hypothetical protein
LRAAGAAKQTVAATGSKSANYDLFLLNDARILAMTLALASER